MATYKTSGLKKLNRLLKKLDTKHIDSTIEDVIYKSADDSLAHAQALADNHYFSGSFKSGLYKKITKVKNGRWFFTIGSEAEDAIWIEHGTGTKSDSGDGRSEWYVHVDMLTALDGDFFAKYPNARLKTTHDEVTGEENTYVVFTGYEGAHILRDTSIWADEEMSDRIKYLFSDLMEK
jgi:hypothetical protein